MTMKVNDDISRKNKKINLSWVKSHVILLVFVYALCCIGGTYAYFALSAESTNTIVGVTAVPSLDLDVSKVIPNSNNNVMVPQLESALGTAISSQYNCIDGNGNTVCQVFRVDVTNDGTGNVRINGIISFNGITNMPNLKWKRLENATTISSSYTSKTASTMDVAFDTDLLLEKDDSETYYFVVWIDETGSSQTDSGTFGITVKFNSGQGDGVTSTIGSTPSTPFIEEVMKVNAVTDSSIDFSVSSSTSGTNGIYLRSGTENDTNPIYYYRGNVNNNLIFADTCWKIVRTTETGGLKLIYNGVPSNGQCNNTGTASQISTKAFNTSYNSPAYVGYMYSNPYTLYDIDMSSVADSYVYGNDVTYSNGVYTLTNTITSSDWDSLYQDGLKNNHYTCFSTGTTCESVGYIILTDSRTAVYYTLTGGDKIDDALTKMLGADDSNTSSYNTTSSTIKGNSTTEGTLDYWYYTNIQNKGYSSYIEDTVWCNDRSIYKLGGFDPDGGLTNVEIGNPFGTMLTFGDFGTTYDIMVDMMTSGSADFSKLQPKLTCSRNIDRFTVSESNGNGDLDYPVGLLTYSETMLAGGTPAEGNDSYYLYTGSNYWAGSPARFYGIYASEAYVYSDGYLSDNFVDYTFGVRPSVSLKPGFTLTGNGDGSVTNPYVVG